MVAVLRWLARFLGFGDPFADARLRARLTEEEALAIAQKAAAGLPHDLRIHLAAITEEAGERLGSSRQTLADSPGRLKLGIETATSSAVGEWAFDRAMLNDASGPWQPRTGHGVADAVQLRRCSWRASK